MMMLVRLPTASPAPKYRGTVVCRRCHAEFSPGKWILVSYEGTSSIPYYEGRVPDGHCPACLRAP